MWRKVWRELFDMFCGHLSYIAVAINYFSRSAVQTLPLQKSKTNTTVCPIPTGKLDNIGSNKIGVDYFIRHCKKVVCLGRNIQFIKTTWQLPISSIVSHSDNTSA